MSRDHYRLYETAPVASTDILHISTGYKTGSAGYVVSVDLKHRSPGETASLVSLAQYVFQLPRYAVSLLFSHYFAT